MSDDCIFCKIIKGSIPNYTVYEDNNFLSFLDINPQAKGHTLVIPKRHFPVFGEIKEDEICDLWLTVKKVRDRIKDVLNPDGFNIGWNDGAAAGQVVPHLHIHIIPRWQDDGGTGIHASVNHSGNINVGEIAELFKN